nr:NADH dehydrogenase subunit 6 [Acanthocinus griseus]
MLLIISLIMIFSIMFIFLNHPLSLGLILLIQTILISLMTGMLNYNFWFSYILFLIMIGGMLILFIYMTSVASNEKFNFSSSLSLMLFLSMTLMLIMLFMDSYYINFPLNTHEYKNFMYNYNYLYSMTKLFNLPLLMIYFMIINYLLITLIMVVKITNLKNKTLRKLN